jgi:hypothetical protein
MKCVEKIKTHFVFDYFFSESLAFSKGYVEKYCRFGQTTDNKYGARKKRFAFLVTK